MSDLMTTSEIAKFCGLSEKTICKEIKAGRLPARRTGSGYKTLRHLVENFRENYYGKGIANETA